MLLGLFLLQPAAATVVGVEEDGITPCDAPGAVPVTVDGCDVSGQCNPLESDHAICLDPAPVVWLPDIVIDQAPPDTGLGQLQPSPSAPSGEATDLGNADRLLGDGIQDRCGNPISVLSRNKTQTEIDYVGAGQLPLRIVRTYNSKFAADAAFGGIFGAGWTSNFEEKIVSVSHPEPTDDPQVREVILQTETGFRFRIKSTDDGPWETSTGRKIIFAYDSAEDIYTWIDRGLIKVFHGSGDIYAIEHETGEQIVFEYEQDSSPARLSKVRHTSGAELTFEYDSSDRVKKITDPAGRDYSYYYGTYNNLDIVNRPDEGGAFTAVNYDYADWGSSLNKNQLVKIKHPELSTSSSKFGYANHINEASYTENGYSGVNRFEFTKTATSPQLVIDVTNPHGKVAKYRYEDVAGAKRLVEIDGQAHGTCLASNSEYTYDENGFYDKITDEESHVTDYDFNDMGQLLSVTIGSGRPEARTVTSTWYSIWDKPATVSSALLDIEYDIDERGRITEITQTNRSAHGIADQVRKWTITYTAFPASTIVETTVIDGPRTGTDDLTTITRNSSGLITQVSRKVTSTLSLTTAFSHHDAHGRVGRITFPTGMTRDIDYHPRGWITSITDTVDGIARQTQYEYYATGDIKKIIRANGSSLDYIYDDAHRLVQIVDNEDNKQNFFYDTASNVTKHEITRLQLTWVPGDPFCDPFSPPFPECHGGSWQEQDRVKYWKNYEFDSLNRLTKVHRNTIETTEFVYYKNNLVSLIKDDYGRITDVDYDATNFVTETTYRDGGVSKVNYDDDGQVEGVQDPLAQWTNYELDGFGQVWTLDSPSTTASFTYEYDEAGNLTKRTDARGDVLHYAYDALNRLVAVYVGTTSTPPVQTFEYDTDQPGFLYRVVDQAGTHTFLRNEAGEILTRTSNLAGTPLSVSYTYNTMGQVDTMTYPSGLTVDYDYDTLGNVSAVTASGGGLSAPSTVVSSVSSYPWGPVSSFVYGNGESRSKTLDSDYDPYMLYSGAHISRTFTEDGNGNITGFDGRSFGYDEMDRLETHSGPDGSYEYAYDLNGNRNWHRRNGVQTGYGYNPSRTWLETLSGGMSESRSYDANGNTVAIDGRYFDHDELNRYWRYREGGVTVTYTHNAFGERQLKQQGSTVTRFVYEGPSLLHERVGVTQRDYIYLGGEIVGLVKDGALYYVHNDHLGRPEVVTNQVKSVRWLSRNDAFGNTPVTDLIGGFNVGFPGQYYDVESGMYYNYFRTYDPSTGRYLESDPIGLAGGLNTYSYAGFNPTSNIDAYGLTPANAGGAIVGGVVGAVTAAVIATMDEDATLGKVAIAAGAGAVAGAASGAIFNPVGVWAAGTAGGSLASGAAGGAFGSVIGQAATSDDPLDPDISGGQVAFDAAMGGLGASGAKLVWSLGRRQAGPLVYGPSRIGPWTEGAIGGTIEVSGNVIRDFGEAYEGTQIVLTQYDCKIQ